MEAKKFYVSKTVIFNVIALVIAVLANFGYTGELPAGWGIFVPVIVALVNIILRFFTKQPVKL